MKIFELFLSFVQVGLLSIGGGYAAIPLIKSETVTRHAWLTMHEFTDLVTIAEMTPGPIAINSATFVGIRVAGIPGMFAATIGCILPSLVIVSLLSCLYTRYRRLDAMQSVLASLRPAVVALIASAGLSILQTVVFAVEQVSLAHVGWVRLGLFAAALLILRRFKWNPILVMVLCGAAGLCIGVLTGGL